jgi:GDP-D-mannose dehydratase
VRVNPAFVRENEIRVLKGSCNKLEELIGFRPSIELDETLKNMLTGSMV